MLELRPNCEFCDKDLPPDSSEACICSYECTFCKHCVDTILNNVCPNCGGGFAPRPIRPGNELRRGEGLNNHPASSKRVHCKYTLDEIKAFSATIAAIAPHDR